MDAVIAHEFKNAFPLVLTRTLIASAVKAGITYGTYAGVTGGGKKNSTAGFITLIAGSIYQAVMNQADLRTWRTLPKEFQFCRFPTPSDRRIVISAPHSGQRRPVPLEEGTVNVVWVRSVRRGSPLLISQFRLKKGQRIPSDSAPKLVSSKMVTGEQDIKAVQEETLQSKEGLQSSQRNNPNDTDVVPLSHTGSSTVEPPQMKTSEQEESPVLDPSQTESTKTTQTNQSVNNPSIEQEISFDTAMRLERERAKSLGRKKHNQIASLEKKGLKYFKKENWDVALSTFKKMLEIDPESFSANANIGEIYLELGEYELSHKYTLKAIQLMPSHPVPYVNLMYYHVKRGDKERGIEFLKKAVDRGFEDIDHIKEDEDLPEDFRKDPIVKQVLIKESR